MIHGITRRAALGAGLAAIGGAVPAAAQATRALNLNLLGFALGIHVPSTAAVNDILPTLPGMTAPRVTRMDQIRTVAQTVISGAADLGSADPIVTMSAVEAGADLKVVGLFYMNTSLVLVANTDHVREYRDLTKPGTVVAVNGRGDITHVMLLGPLLREGIDIRRINFVEIGGSGGRMRALLAGRVHAVPMHFDQAKEVVARGNYRILMEPWKEYPAWVNEVWVATGSWLRRPENERALVGLLKANLMAFRRASGDFPWFLEAYRKHATVPNAKEAPEAEVRVLWEGLSREVKAWPADGRLDPADVEALVPLYREAGAVAGRANPRNFYETSYLRQALSELG
jgi:NitT/TauT family transport system substrate-binding protein